MRPIDADKIDETVMRLNKDTYNVTQGEYKIIKKVLNEMPTIDVKPEIRDSLFNFGYEAGRGVGREMLRGTIRMMNRELLQIISQEKFYLNEVKEIFERYEKECDE